MIRYQFAPANRERGLLSLGVLALTILPSCPPKLVYTSLRSSAVGPRSSYITYRTLHLHLPSFYAKSELTMSKSRSQSPSKGKEAQDTDNVLDIPWDAPPPYELHSSGSVLASTSRVNGMIPFYPLLEAIVILTAPRLWKGRY